MDWRIRLIMNKALVIVEVALVFGVTIWEAWKYWKENTNEPEDE